MLKNHLNHLLKIVFIIFIGLTFSTNAVAFNFIKDNNSPQNAYSIGFWEYHNLISGKLNKGINEAYFTFIAPSNSDKVYVRTMNGLSIEIVDSRGNSLSDPIHSDYVEYPTTFNYVKVDAKTNYQTFYIKVTRTSATEDIYYSITINKRIRTGHKIFEFSGSAYNSGNQDVFGNPAGVDSSELSIDLTNEDSIPNKAIITRISTDGHLNKSLNGVTHKLYSTAQNIWYTAIVSGIFDIDTTYNLDVHQVWKFKYNFGFASSSIMYGVKATIDYQYDVTNQY